MKRNHFHWCRRILACAAVFCLLMASPGVQPAQASPPGGTYYTNITFLAVPGPDEQICVGKQIELIIGVELTYTPDPKKSDDVEIPPLCPADDIRCREKSGFGGGWITAAAQLGTITPGQESLPPMWTGRVVGKSFYYTAEKEGHERLTFNAEIPGHGRHQDKYLDFDVKKNCELNVHGSVDITRNTTGMEVKGWQPVGSYDVVGMVKVQEDGSINGEGTVSLYEDAFFTGGEDDITCSHLNPWEGNASVELEADPNAWANEDTLVLTLSIGSMQVNTTRVECEGPDDASGYANSPPITIASFDLKFDALPAEGGSTNLGFQFPGGQGEFEMQLIVSPVEAES